MKSGVDAMPLFLLDHPLRNKLYMSKMQFGTILFTYKKYVTQKRILVNKVCNFLNTFYRFCCRFPLINYPLTLSVSYWSHFHFLSMNFSHLDSWGR